MGMVFAKIISNKSNTKIIRDERVEDMEKSIKRLSRDRRIFSYTKYYPERRTGKDRRADQKEYDFEEKLAS